MLRHETMRCGSEGIIVGSLATKVLVGSCFMLEGLIGWSFRRVSQGKVPKEEKREKLDSLYMLLVFYVVSMSLL